MISSVALLVLAVLACWIWKGSITGKAVTDDAAQGLRMTLSLEREGIMSLRSEAPFEPTMYREPFPVLVSAGMVRLHDGLRGKLELPEYFSGDGVRFVKLQNILWMLVLCAGVFLAVHFASSSWVLALACAVLVNVKVPLVPSGLQYLGIDSLETDLPAAALLALGSALLAIGMARRRPVVLAFAGITFGALALTKAAFLYVFLVMALFLIGSSIGSLIRSAGARAVAGPLLAVTCFALVAGGWMYRNYERFGVFEISERGGVVLLIRAFKDEMNPVEYRGTFYVWAPNALRPLMGKLLGFSPADLDRHGRLERLNRSSDSNFFAEDDAAEAAGRPDLAVTYYRKARAERVRVRRQMQSSGGDPALADEVLKQEALQIIRSKPGAHLRLTLAFLWRGALLSFPLLVFAWAYASLKRRADLYWLVLPALGMVLFYAFLSHFISRYGVPMHSIALCAAFLLGHEAWKRWGPA